MRSPLGHRLADARRASGKSREVVAVAIGKSYSSVVAYESGSVVPPLDVLRALAKCYGVSTAALVDEEATTCVA